MTDSELSKDEALNAYVDGELDKASRQRLLLEIEGNEEVRARLCELRNTKDWVQFAFEGETAPSRSLPDAGLVPAPARLWRVAASLLLMVVAFGAGWYGQLTQQAGSQQWVLRSSEAKPHYVLLHIGTDDRLRYATVLERADELMQEYRDRDVQVEVIATAGGLGLLRSDLSPYAARITEMIETHDNVRFFACINGLNRLREQGVEPMLIPGVKSDNAGADHLVERLHQGWTYIRI